MKNAERRTQNEERSRATGFSKFFVLRSAFCILLLTSCTPPGPPNKPNDREWTIISSDYQWIQTLRAAQRPPEPNAPRKQQIEAMLENHRRIEPTYVAFVDKVREYHERTADPRAAALLAKEKLAIGDEYMNVLSRYDRALEFYKAALEYDPNSAEARSRIATAEQRRYVSMSSFANIKSGMKEAEVRSLLGLPREDWIKQVVQNRRIYAVWIYPKADGGASAVYFDNGSVYHTNWTAAAPPAPADKPVQ